MKKLLVLMLVLGLTSVAGAVLTDISISVNGEITASEIWISPSDTVVIDIHSAVANEMGLAYINFNLAGAGTLYTLSGARVTDNAGDQGGYVGPYDYDVYREFELTVADTGGIIVAGTMFEVDLHCEGLGDVFVELQEGVGYTVVDTLTIHQIPEPMTVALLGLGGLFLRRRK